MLSLLRTHYYQSTHLYLSHWESSWCLFRAGFLVPNAHCTWTHLSTSSRLLPLTRHTCKSLCICFQKPRWTHLAHVSCHSNILLHTDWRGSLCNVSTCPCRVSSHLRSPRCRPLHLPSCTNLTHSVSHTHRCQCKHLRWQRCLFPIHAWDNLSTVPHICLRSSICELHVLQPCCSSTRQCMNRLLFLSTCHSHVSTHPSTRHHTLHHFSRGKFPCHQPFPSWILLYKCYHFSISQSLCLINSHSKNFLHRLAHSYTS